MGKNTKKGATVSKNGCPVLKNPILVTVALTLALVILLGVVAGIIIGVREARALVSYGGVRIEKSAAAYLATTFKTKFKSKYNAVDHPEFWASEYSDGVTYGELLEKETEAYIREITVGAYLFDRYATLTREEKKNIKELAASAILDFGCTDKKDFNERAAKMGFDYNGFLDALILIYKNEQAKVRIYGDGGSVLAAGGFASECEKYYSAYTFAKILVIRTEYEYETDENGKYTVDVNGNLVTRPLTAAESESRNADITEIREAIIALENGTDGQMTEMFFDTMLKKYDIDNYTTEGYYFSPVDGVTGLPFATATQSFVKQMGAEMLEFIYTRQIGEFAELPIDGGICFIYRGQLTSGAYSSMTHEYFFEDFYSDAADYLYATSLNELAPEVSVKEKYRTLIDIVALPYNWEFVIKSGF